MLLSVCSGRLPRKACNVWSPIERDTGFSQGFVECCLWLTVRVMRDEPKTMLIRRLDILTGGVKGRQSTVR